MSEAVPPHRVALFDGWSMWRAAVLRSAGFPASTVLQLGGHGAIAAIDALLSIEREVEVARAAAIAACEAALHASDGGEHKALRRALDKIRSGRGPDEPPAAIAAAIDVLRAAITRRDAARSTADEAIARERRIVSGSLRELARDPRFREAIVWQNRALIDTMLDPLLATPIDATDSQTRQKEVRVAGYGQRYAVKNDTIGFFGPVGWARFADRDEPIVLRAGAELLDQRDVHFEYWCIDALAEQLAASPALRADLAPRRMPTVRLEGDVVHFPIAKSARLGREYVAVLAACDGATSARAIAQRLGGELELDEAGVFELLDELVDQRLATWTLEVPTAGQHPERYLRAQLERLAPSEARAEALAQLDAIEAARDRVARAAGDWRGVDEALRAFDQLFSATTARAPTRRAGQMYAGRTLLYEETRRAVDVELGAPAVAKLAHPMSLVCASARWYTYEVARAYAPIFRSIYEERCAARGSRRIDYADYLQELVPHFARQGEVAATMQPIIDGLHARWVELLGATAGAKRIHRTAAQLAPQVAAAFAAPHPGWPQARFHSPDLMIAATDLAAFERGDLSWVVNEIHVGAHTFVRPVFLNRHGAPAALLAARRADLGRPAVVTVEARANALRSDHFTPEPSDIDIQTGDARSWRAPDHVIDAAELVIEEREGRLLACTRDDRRRFDLVEVLEPYLQLAAEMNFTILPPLPHMPRVSIDDLVVARESWTFEPAAIPFASAPAADRLVAARRWAREHALPRFVFMRVPEEGKPCFVDLESGVYVEAMARLVRKASSVRLTEMLPAIDHTWLPDAEGRTYTAELRMVFVDPVPWQTA